MLVRGVGRGGGENSRSLGLEEGASPGPGALLARAQLDRVADRLELLQLGVVHALGLVLAVLVEPILRGVEEGDEGLRRLGRDEIGQGAGNLGPHAVHVLLHRVLALLRLLHHAVLQRHLELLVDELLEDLGGQAADGGGHGHVDFLNLLLLLGYRRGGIRLHGLLAVGILGRGVLAVLGGRVGVHGGLGGRGNLGRRGNLLLDLLDSLRGLHGDEAVEVEANLNLELGLAVVRVGRRDGADVERADLSHRVGRKKRGGGVLGLQGERLVAEEGHHLGRGHRVVALEELHVLNLAAVSLPREGDGEGERVHNLEIANAELRGEHGALKRAAAGDALGRVEGPGARHPEERLELGADEGHARRVADELDSLDVRGDHASLGHGLLNGLHHAVEERGGELLHLLAGHLGVDVHVVHDALDAERRLRVGGEDLLHLLNRGAEAKRSAGVGLDVDLLGRLEFLAEVVHHRLVEGGAAEVAVEAGGENLELRLGEAHHANLHGGGADVHEDDVVGIVAELRRLEDTVRERRRGGLVHEAHDVEARDGGGVEHGSALRVGEKDGHGDDRVGHLGAVVSLRDHLEVAEDHGDEPFGGEGLLLAEVVDGDEDLVVGPAGDGEEKGGDQRLHLGIGEPEADEALELDDGVLGLHVDLIGGGTADESLRRGAGIGGIVGSAWVPSWGPREKRRQRARRQTGAVGAGGSAAERARERGEAQRASAARSPPRVTLTRYLHSRRGSSRLKPRRDAGRRRRRRAISDRDEACRRRRLPRRLGKRDSAVAIDRAHKRTCLSPKLTIAGVSRLDSVFSTTSMPLRLASATTELTLPKSRPTTLIFPLFF